MPPSNDSLPPLKPTWRRYRSPHRMRSHHEANASAEDDNVPAVLDHPLVPGNDSALVTAANELGPLIEHLRGAGCFGYDSEFIGEHSYYPKLCVIQVATSDRVAIIDPLTDLDLTPFWELLADSSVEKIVHSGQQDLEPVVRHLALPPRGAFDTQIAAAFIGVGHTKSLDTLVRDLIGVDLGRTLKFCQWDLRPLSPVQLRYAANDVRYLPLLRQTIGRKLDELGHSGWAIEECGCLSDPALYGFDPHSQRLRVRVRGVESLSPRNLAVLYALVAWREAAARQQDLPPRTLLKDHLIFELARAPVDSMERLHQVRGLPRPVLETYGAAIVEVTRSALDKPLPAVCRKPARYWEHRSEIEKLWSAVRDCCLKRSIDPAVVTNKKEVAQLVRNQMAGEPTADVRLVRGWRRELLGPVLDEILK